MHGIYPRFGTIIIVIIIIIITFVLPIIAIIMFFRAYRMLQNIDKNLEDINRKLDRKEEYY